MRVLIVDDDGTNLRLLGAMLLMGGVEVVEANSAADALALLAAAPADFHAVLMDLRMPGMDGLTATRAIRRRADASASIPIAIVTADDSYDLEAASKEAGANRIIRKPLDISGLHDALARLLLDAQPQMLLA